MRRHLPAALVTLTAVTATAAGTTLATSPQPLLTAARVVHAPRTQSGNWSGYVSQAGLLGISSIRGSWRVPTIIPSGAGDRYSADWIGIGGNDGLPDLIQAGTEQDWIGGKPVYYAWSEILPEPEQQLTSFPVQPGDLITVSVQETFPLTWVLDISDARTGISMPQTLFYPSLGMSAGWIHEAPMVNGSVAPLTQTTPVVFTGGTLNGGPIAAAPGAHAVDMLNGSGAQVATTSDLSGSGTAFQVADGPTAPPPPAG